jgi:hypothetical protein
MFWYNNIKKVTRASKHSVYYDIYIIIMYTYLQYVYISDPSQYGTFVTGTCGNFLMSTATVSQTIQP